MLETRNVVTFSNEKWSTDLERDDRVSVEVQTLFLDLVDACVWALFVVFNWIAHICLTQFSIQILHFKVKSDLERQYIFWHKGIGKLSLVLEPMFFPLFYNEWDYRLCSKNQNIFFGTGYTFIYKENWKSPYNMQSNSEKMQKRFSCQDQSYCGTLEEDDDQDQEDKGSRLQYRLDLPC